MRPLPIVAGGASGGFVGLCVQVAREVFFSDSVIRVPPEPELFPVLPGDTSTSSNFILHLDWTSFLLGICAGVLIWPLLDLAFLARLAVTGSVRRVFGLPPSGLYRLLE